jgi:hypothetical protein
MSVENGSRKFIMTGLSASESLGDIQLLWVAGKRAKG